MDPEGGCYEKQASRRYSEKRHARVGRTVHRPAIPISRVTVIEVTAVAVENTAAAAAAAAIDVGNTAVVAAVDKITAAAAAGRLCRYAYRDTFIAVLASATIAASTSPASPSLNAPSPQPSGQDMAVRPARLPLELLRLDKGSLQFIQRKAIF